MPPATDAVKTVTLMLSGIPLFPEQASNLAPEVDNLYFFVTAVAAGVALLVVVLVIIFAVMYRDRAGEKVGHPIHGSVLLELGWTIIPFLVTMVIFAWAAAVFFDMVRAPDAAQVREWLAGSGAHGNTGFTRLTTRGRSHTLPRSVASEAEYERLQARCSCDFQLLAATQV